MTHRVLYGEKVSDIFSVQSEELSDALAEAALLVRDYEKKTDPYSPIFSTVVSWDADSEMYDLLIFVRNA